MKKYKHKQTGKVVKFYPETNTYMIQDNTGTVFSPEFIEGTNDWEEVTEDNKYEILSFKNSNFTYTLGESGEYKVDDFDYNGWNIDYMLNAMGKSKNKLHIHSIKRLSDGEVFSVGDTVTERLSDKKDFKINAFEVHSNKLCIYIAKGSTNASGSLEFLDKVKQPIFKTEDGVDVYEKEAFYYIGDAGNINKASCLYKGDGDFSKTKTFSTKEAAETYVLMNKPVLSINDLLDIKKKIGCLGDTLIESCIQLVKTRK